MIPRNYTEEAEEFLISPVKKIKRVKKLVRDCSATVKNKAIKTFKNITDCSSIDDVIQTAADSQYEIYSKEVLEEFCRNRSQTELRKLHSQKLAHVQGSRDRFNVSLNAKEEINSRTAEIMLGRLDREIAKKDSSEKTKQNENQLTEDFTRLKEKIDISVDQLNEITGGMSEGNQENIKGMVGLKQDISEANQGIMELTDIKEAASNAKQEEKRRKQERIMGTSQVLSLNARVVSSAPLKDLDKEVITIVFHINGKTNDCVQIVFTGWMADVFIGWEAEDLRHLELPKNGVNSLKRKIKNEIETVNAKTFMKRQLNTNLLKKYLKKVSGQDKVKVFIPKFSRRK